MIEVKAPPPSADVIELSVVREGRLLRGMQQKCSHNRVSLNALLTTIECKTCKAHLNPVAWLIDHSEYWTYVKRLVAEYNEARERHAMVSRCKCQHCGKMTRVPKDR